MKLDTQVYFGDGLKALGDGKVGGYLVRFGGQDLQGEYFTAKTYFGAHNGDGMDCMFHHGIPVKSDLAAFADYLFQPLTTKRDEIGIWAETVLDLSNAYEKKVYELVEAGKLGWSSGAAGHTVRKSDDGEIKRWVIAEGSITPTPAEPRNRALTIKTLIEDETGEPIDEPDTEHPTEDETVEPNTPTLINSPQDNGNQPEAQPTETGQPVSGAEVTPVTEATAVKNSSDIQVLESETMTDAQQTPVDAARFDTLETSVKSLSTVLDSIVSKLDAMPVSQNPGYVTADGGAADRNIKSFGDYLVAVKRGDTKRLETVYGVKALGDGALSEDQGATGGYLIPQEYIPRLLAVVNQTSGIVPLVNVVNVGSSSGKIPSLDQFFAPTAGVGNSAFAGGLKATLTAEGGTFTETEPSFEMVEYNINKVGGVIYVTTEMMQDSPVSIESLLTQYVGVAIANKEEYFIFRGSGVGQPLGILNSDAAVSTGPDTNSTFAYADAAEILSRFKSVGGSPTWAAHPSTIPDLMRFEVGTGGAVWVANVQGQVPMSLLGYPVRFSEHLPQADNAGHVGLYDFSAYTLFRKGGISIAYSEHAAFTSGKVAWRFEERLDGKPNLRNKITLADPQGSYTVSPFSLFTD